MWLRPSCVQQVGKSVTCSTGWQCRTPSTCVCPHGRSLTLLHPSRNMSWSEQFSPRRFCVSRALPLTFDTPLVRFMHAVICQATIPMVNAMFEKQMEPLQNRKGKKEAKNSIPPGVLFSSGPHPISVDSLRCIVWLACSPERWSQTRSRCSPLRAPASTESRCRHHTRQGSYPHPLQGLP